MMNNATDFQAYSVDPCKLDDNSSIFDVELIHNRKDTIDTRISDNANKNSSLQSGTSFPTFGLPEFLRTSFKDLEELERQPFKETENYFSFQKLHSFEEIVDNSEIILPTETVKRIKKQKLEKITESNRTHTKINPAQKENQRDLKKKVKIVREFWKKSNSVNMVCIFKKTSLRFDDKVKEKAIPKEVIVVRDFSNKKVLS